MANESLLSGIPLTQTPERKTIVRGAPTSSELLRDVHESIQGDVLELDRRTRDTSNDLSHALAMVSAQVEAVATRLQSLEAQLPSASGRWLADFFTEDYLHGDNAAAISTLYGQATLPIRTSQDKLVGRDSRDEVWVPPGSLLHYSYQTSTPAEADWLPDEEALRALDGRGDTAWFRTRSSSGAVWIRAQVPARLNGSKQANVIQLHPFPALSFHLNSVEYRTPDGTWTSLDLSYLEGWNSSASRVEGVGNVRLLFGLASVVELRIKLTTSGTWGFRELALREVEFHPSANLSVDFAGYSGGTLTEAFVYGQNQDALSYLPATLNGTQVSIGLSQASDGQSPLVTGIETRN